VTDLSALLDPRDKAEVHWSADGADRLALARRADWSGLTALEQLWPVLAERHGDALALDAHAKPPEQLSFQELHSAILRAAAGFAALGVVPGDGVALFAENGPRWFLADQGLMRAGAADAVRGSGAPLAELSYILRDSGASALVVESAALLEKLTPQLLELADLKFVVVLEGASPAAGTLAIPCLGWDAFMALGATSPLPPPAPGGPARLATLLYTSGTTGEPKGVPLSHANLLHQLQTLGVAVAPNPGDRVLSVLPIWHAYERTAEYFLLACGCRQTYTSLKHFKADLQRVRPNYMISVPRLWEALLAGFDDALAALPPARRRLLTAGLAISRFHCSHWRQAQDQTLAAEPLLARLAGEQSWPWPAGRAIAWPPPSSGPRCASSWPEAAWARPSVAGAPWPPMWTASLRRLASSCWWATASPRPVRCSPAGGPGPTGGAAPAAPCPAPPSRWWMPSTALPWAGASGVGCWPGAPR
jgi:long-chain acyl-CoA synthetase